MIQNRIQCPHCGGDGEEAEAVYCSDLHVFIKQLHLSCMKSGCMCYCFFLNGFS